MLKENESSGEFYSFVIMLYIPSQVKQTKTYQIHKQQHFHTNTSAEEKRLDWPDIYLHIHLF